MIPFTVGEEITSVYFVILRDYFWMICFEGAYIVAVLLLFDWALWCVLSSLADAIALKILFFNRLNYKTNRTNMFDHFTEYYDS